MFTNRFRDRLVNLRLDVNNDVASSAMRLLTVLARQEFEMNFLSPSHLVLTSNNDRHKLLSQEHNELIYKMLIEDAHGVRSAAAAFTEVAYLDGVLTPLFEEETSSECHES
jgi:hypothetical protein